MKANSDNGICSLTNPFSDDVIIDIFYVASIGTELILLVDTILVILTLFILIFFNLVGHCMSLRDVSSIMLLLLNVLLDIILTSTKRFGIAALGCWTWLTILAWRDSITRSNNSPGLSSLKVSILVLQLCSVLSRIVICSKTTGSYSVSKPLHIVIRNHVLIWLQLLPILVNV